MFWLEEIGSNHETTKTSKQKGVPPLTRRRLKSLGWEQSSKPDRGLGENHSIFSCMFPTLLSKRLGKKVLPLDGTRKRRLSSSAVAKNSSSDAGYLSGLFLFFSIRTVIAHKKQLSAR